MIKTLKLILTIYNLIKNFLYDTIIRKLYHYKIKIYLLQNIFLGYFFKLLVLI